MQRALGHDRAHYHARHVKVIETAQGMSVREREIRLKAAEWMTKHLAGDENVTLEDATREEFRAEVWVYLRRNKPLREFPRTRAAAAYGVMRHMVEVSRESPDRKDATLWAHGRAEYATWWTPISRDFDNVARLFSGLAFFGGEEDAGFLRELLQRGDTLCGWLLTRFDVSRSRPPSAVAVPYLPRWSIEPAAFDRWWWGKWRESAVNVCRWWSSWEPRARQKIPERYQPTFGDTNGVF